MTTLKTIYQREFDTDAPEVDRTSFKHRRAARAVVTDGKGGVALLFASKRGYYKLPGGGVEDGEDIAMALGRELQEEIGCKAHVTGELGKIVEYRDFWEMQQTSFCYLATLDGKKGRPDFTEEEKADGFEVAWMPSLQTAIDRLEAVQPPANDLDVHFMRLRDLTFLRAAQSVAIQ